MDKEMKVITVIVGAMVAIALISAVVSYAVDRDEIHECHTWASQAAQYSGYYITQWQKQECDAHRIFVTGVVK